MTEAERDLAIVNGFATLLRPLGHRFDLVDPQWDDETCFYNGYRCELVSDDDGYFHFHPWSNILDDYDPSVTVLIPYP